MTKLSLQNYERLHEKGLSVLNTIAKDLLISESGKTHNRRDEITVYL